MAHLHLATNGYDLKRQKQFSRDLRLRLDSATGIEKAAYANAVPLSIYGAASERIQFADATSDRDGVISVRRSVVAPGYFSLMRIPLLAGRDFTEQDDLGKPRVIIVNHTFAKKFFGDKDPIGRRVRVSGNWSTIVGMVKDSKYRRLQEESAPFFYGPFRQIFFSGYDHFFFVRAAGSMTDGRARGSQTRHSRTRPECGLF